MSSERFPKTSCTRRAIAAFLAVGAALPIAGCGEVTEIIGSGLPVSSPCSVDSVNENTKNTVQIRSDEGKVDSGASLYVVRDITGQLCAVVSPTKLSQYHSDRTRFMSMFTLDIDGDKYTEVDSGEYSSYTDPVKIDTGKTAVIAAFASPYGGHSDSAVGIIATIDNTNPSADHPIEITIEGTPSYSEFTAKQ